MKELIFGPLETRHQPVAIFMDHFECNMLSLCWILDILAIVRRPKTCSGDWNCLVIFQGFPANYYSLSNWPSVRIWYWISIVKKHMLMIFCARGHPNTRFWIVDVLFPLAAWLFAIHLSIWCNMPTDNPNMRFYHKSPRSAPEQWFKIFRVSPPEWLR